MVGQNSGGPGSKVAGGGHVHVREDKDSLNWRSYPGLGHENLVNYRHVPESGELQSKKNPFLLGRK